MKTIKKEIFKYARKCLNTILDSFLDKNIKYSLIKNMKDKNNNKNEIIKEDLIKKLGDKTIKNNKKKMN